MNKNVIVAWCVAAALAGCGGGGSSGGTTTGDETHTGGGATTGGETTGGATTGGGETDAGTATTGGGGGEGDFATRVAAGQDKFDHVCGTCHPDGGEDTGPDLHGKHFTVERMTNQIRNGSSHMRPIPVARLSDEELPNVLAWLSTIQAVDGVAH